jgi:hypothetical protein
MSIQQYTNFVDIDVKKQSEGHFILDKDLFVITKNEFEEVDFGHCKYDVMEVAVYDVNNNLLPQKSGNNVAYIKTGDIKHYLYNTTGATNQPELAINAERLLKDLGFSNGILKLNINFVRNRLGTDNVDRRAWIQEISATRQEVRILPLKVGDANITNINSKEINTLQNLHKDFKYYKSALLDSIYSFENTSLSSIDSFLQSKFGNDFFNILKKDFGLSKFEDFKKSIIEDFNTSVTYYLTNKYYDVEVGTFGQALPQPRFEDCEQYDFKMITDEIQNILFKCINHNSGFLNRTQMTIKDVPKEFTISELQHITKNNLESFATPTILTNNVYDPTKVDILFNDPIQPTPLVQTSSIDKPPDTHINIPQEVPVKPKNPTFYYQVNNIDSGMVGYVTFTNAGGDTIRKVVSSNKSIQICAEENTVSFSYAIATQDNTMHSIIKLGVCSVIDISDVTYPNNTTTTVKPIIRDTTSTTTTTTTRYTQSAGGGGCFIEGTLVTLPNRDSIPIEQVIIGMEVMTWNEQTGKQEVGVVTDLIRPMSSDIISIDLSVDSIQCTDEHPICVIDKGWASYNPAKTKRIHNMDVELLSVGDLVLNSFNEPISINSIEPIVMLSAIQTYNLTIAENSTYYANGILVHNKIAKQVQQ